MKCRHEFWLGDGQTLPCNIAYDHRVHVHFGDHHAWAVTWSDLTPMDHVDDLSLAPF